LCCNIILCHLRERAEDYPHLTLGIGSARDFRYCNKQ
jgi:hypothetical protein